MTIQTNSFTIKDSGEREGFDTGAVRDVSSGKPRYDLIPPQPLYRVAMHYGGGAEKYSPWNWAKGMPASRCWESLERHAAAYKEGRRDEDHLAAIVWNAFAIMFMEELPELYGEFLDMPTWDVAWLERVRGSRLERVRGSNES